MIEVDISKVSQLSGLPSSTLRYYEERGLIKSIGRKGLKRVYNHNEVMMRLSLISLGQEAQFSLEEIALMLNNQQQPEIDKEKLVLKANEIEAKIQNLILLKKGILHIVNCKAENQLLCPKFNKIMSLSLKRNKK
nr:MerR family transcriptional regulator [uncultured Moellerella sp.]